MMLDFNRTAHKTEAFSTSIQRALDSALMAGKSTAARRNYLGASAVGPGCKRKIQWRWQIGEDFEAQTYRIFDRGHWGESYVRMLFTQAGFTLQDGGPGTSFSQLDGRFAGHCDGVFRDGPPVIQYPALWEMKVLGDKGAKGVERHGLKKAKPEYYSQVNLYMAYLGLTENPAIFTVMNANTMAIHHYPIPFDAAEAQKASDLAVQIIEATEHGETMPRASDDPDFFECRFCAFKERCHG